MFGILNNDIFILNQINSIQKIRIEYKCFFEFFYRYEVVGGMQDFNYARSNAFEITFELSCCKYPPGSTIPDQWRLNKESLIKYLEQAHIGIKGNIQIYRNYI